MSKLAEINLEHIFSFGHEWGECNPAHLDHLQTALVIGAVRVAIYALPPIMSPDYHAAIASRLGLN